jgi:hypothetical protein
MDAACYNEFGDKKICLFYVFTHIFLIIFSKNVGGISYNVPAVYDVLAARISKCVAFAGRTKCAGAMAWE